MTKYDIIFISTCCNHHYIYKLMESILVNNTYLSACLIVINQDENKITGFIETKNTEIKIIEHNNLVNTSVARNIGIKYLINENLSPTFISFPDDDSSYNHIFFERLSLMISQNDLRNFITDVYCTGSNQLYRKVKYEDNTLLTKKDFDIVGAVNIIVNFKTFLKTSYFDVNFGVNAKYGAGEDGDYFIRAISYESFFYTKKLYNYHPSGYDKYKKMTYSQIRRRLINYGRGGVALLCKHKMYLSAAYLTFRALGGCFHYLFSGNIAIAFAYFQAFFVRLFYLFKFRLFSFK